MKITELFNKPRLIGLCANANEGKSNTLYYMIDQLRQSYKCTFYAYGLKESPSFVHKIHSVTELEQIQNSIIIIDEMFSLFDLDNRKVKAQIENTIRLVFHNNNVIVLSGLAENFKKFLSAKLDAVIFKKVTLSDMINGSRLKNIVNNYQGDEKGTAVLNLGKGEALFFDGTHYKKIDVPYLKDYDTKAKNKPILVPKSVPKKVLKK